jgi:hypothetical protein
MPTKFAGYAVQVPAGIPANGYVQLDALNGMVDCTIINNTNANIHIVTNATDETAALAEETAGRYMVISQNSAGVYQFRCDPSRTWVEWQGATVGSNRHSFILDW